VTQEEFSAVCPYLGLADDADSHATYATEAHRCYRLPSPTRIATPHQEMYCLGANHVTCPVYQGEGLPQTQRPTPPAAIPAAAATGVAAGAAAGGELAPVPGPKRGQQRNAPPPGEQRPRRPAGQGTLGPRPRSGGISMPVATIGLFALALVVVGLAFGIQSLVGDGGDNGVSPADAVATRDALNKTKTAQATGGTQTQAPGQTQTQQPGQSVTPGTGTPTNRTPSASGTPGTGAKTYTVKSGDTCGSIAQNNGVTLAALLQANNLTEDDCRRLAVDQILKIP